MEFSRTFSNGASGSGRSERALVRPAAGVSQPGNETSNVSPEISIWVTSGDERFATAPKASRRAASPAPGTDQLRLNPTYSTNLCSYDDGVPDPDLTRFSIDHDREYILMLRQARQANPDLYLFSTPGAPGWMKFNGTMLGGSRRNHHFAVYAKYYLRFLQGYAAEGVPVQALTSQNELDTDRDGRMPACIWPREYEIQFVP
jgi:hypothetical protein